MVQLQKPAFAYMGGRLRPWDEAVLHIGAEAITRGLNVFEGIKGYWQVDGRFGLVMLERHYQRLRRSARLLHIPCDASYEELQAAIATLLRVLLENGRDMWVRTTLYVTEGHWGEGTVSDLVVTAFHADPHIPDPVAVGVSTWQRSLDVSLPARIKTGTNYQVSRLAKIEGRKMGCSEMILLNHWGRVAESTAACVLMVRDGVVFTPPSTEGALESVTLDIVERLAASIGIPFVRRPIDRTELLVADEIGLCGTLAEVTLAKSIEGSPLPADAPILTTLQRRYFDAVRGVSPHPFVAVTPLDLLEESSVPQLAMSRD
jgi:branched-chain amino acid aminotransferase